MCFLLKFHIILYIIPNFINQLKQKMASILDLLNSDLGETLINGASKQLGQDKAKTTTA